MMRFFMAICTSFFSIVAIAAPQEWVIVPKESQLTFTATQNDAPISGEFKRFNGMIFFDREVMKDNRVAITVDTGSLSTSYSDLTATLVTPDWLSVKIFPKAEFKATDFLKTADKTYKAKGMLTIRDHILPATITFQEEEAPSKDKVRIKGNFSIKRLAFGVGQGEWVSTKEVKDEVIISFVVTAIKK